MNGQASRRQVLKALAAVAASLGLGATSGCSTPHSLAQEELEPRAYLPLVSKESTPTHTPTATPTHTPTATPTHTPTAT
ncbi:MAG: twin-arginine translocation signal domain-containing protein, partial [Anaerolineae bacterium]|nr:twin-arginine translocation signal domain-containing protein [Anaerolineae bacterium]